MKVTNMRDYKERKEARINFLNYMVASMGSVIKGNIESGNQHSIAFIEYNHEYMRYRFELKELTND